MENEITSLWELIDEVEDPRNPSGLRYPLSNIWRRRLFSGIKEKSGKSDIRRRDEPSFGLWEALQRREANK